MPNKEINVLFVQTFSFLELKVLRVAGERVSF